jgi:hypothetical protein
MLAILKCSADSNEHYFEFELMAEPTSLFEGLFLCSIVKSQLTHELVKGIELLVEQALNLQVGHAVDDSYLLHAVKWQPGCKHYTKKVAAHYGFRHTVVTETVRDVVHLRRAAEHSPDFAINASTVCYNNLCTFHANKCNKNNFVALLKCHLSLWEIWFIKHEMMLRH